MTQLRNCTVSVRELAFLGLKCRFLNFSVWFLNFWSQLSESVPKMLAWSLNGSLLPVSQTLSERFPRF